MIIKFINNPYANFTIDDLNNEDLVNDAMSDYVSERSNGSGDWSWSDSDLYLTIQSEFLDERFQELCECHCHNPECTVNGACLKRIELEKQVNDLYKRYNV